MSSPPRRTGRQRPAGQPTRGKTALNRLRQVDVYILLAWAGVLSGASPLIVDVGYGAYPWTALEMLARWREVNPRLRLLGLEIDPERVANALPYAEPGQIDFQQGGFNVAANLGGEQAAVIRAYNVLRQYEESAVPPALMQMAAALAPGGLLIEGTSNPSGRVVAFDVYQKAEDGLLQHRELVLGVNFREAPDLTHLQAVLPKRLIHHMEDPRPKTFFQDWRLALHLARGRGYLSPRRLWVEAARILIGRGYPIDPRPRILSRGYLPLRDSLL